MTDKTATERLCDTCKNDRCSYGGKGPTIDQKPTNMCEHYKPMTATERLRALLDERGVEWWQSANTLGCIFTHWYSPLFGDEVCAMDSGDGCLELFNHTLTPEQAIAATLGAGTCEMEYVSDWLGWHCKSCDNLRQGLPDQKPKYCPNCGAVVMDR